MTDTTLAERVEERVRAWDVAVERTLETPGSFVAFGRRGDRPVVLKVVRRPGDEWRCGAVLRAFDGRGTVRAVEHVGGAVLLERLDPGTSLASLTLGGRDDEATAILADVIRRMAPPEPPSEVGAHVPGAFATVEEWGEGFGRYQSSGDGQIAADLVEQGRIVYAALCASQRRPRLLHGDLQHYNVLLDAARGWVAIDPKGVVGEVEYEVGASLRNPCERPDLFATPEAARRRLACFEAVLGLGAGRALAWAFAQAVLSAVWSVEDGDPVEASNPSLLLARAIRPLLA